MKTAEILEAIAAANNYKKDFKVGDIFHKPAFKAYPVFPGAVEVAGRFIKDGFYWDNPTQETVLKVRKTRGQNAIDIYLSGGGRRTIAQ
jgi:hypothetical protein